MREIHDQYSEIAPESEKLKGRKHRRSGVGALPLAVCAIFVVGMFLHPYISVSQTADTGREASLTESFTAEDPGAFARPTEPENGLADTSEEETSSISVESTQPETGMIEESMAPE